MKKALPTLLVLGILLFMSGWNVKAQPSGVSDERFARLAKGVNITRWFWLNDDQSAGHYRDYVSDAQLEAIRAAGFTHVRLVIEPLYLFDLNAPDDPDRVMLDAIEAAVERILSHDLAVIVDIHGWEDDFKAALIGKKAYQDTFAAMWGAVAARFAPIDPERVFFEVMNEPAPEEPSDWLPLQEHFVKAIRAAAPDNTIIVGGPFWNSIEGLLLLQPLDDRNIVYNFHFYDPFIFTHQAATWVGDVVESLHDVPYPSTGERCAALPTFSNDDANGWAAGYCTSDAWDAARISSWIQEAVDWAARYDLRLTCNEFGVYPIGAPPEDRLTWFRDVRTTLEVNGIGWTVWGYDDVFGLAYNAEQPEMDAAVLQALGMKR